MKKFLSTISCILVGLFLGFFLLKQYKYKENVKTVSKENYKNLLRCFAYFQMKNMLQSEQNIKYYFLLKQF